MQKVVIISLLFMTFTISGFSQISSDNEATETLKWIIENPQINNDSIFIKKSADLLKWYVLNYPNVEFRTTGISEFMDSSKADKFFKEITTIYAFSEFNNQINGEMNQTESAFLSISNVLDYYEKIIVFDEELKDSVLQKYNTLSEKDLRKEMKKF